MCFDTNLCCGATVQFFFFCGITARSENGTSYRSSYFFNKMMAQYRIGVKNLVWYTEMLFCGLQECTVVADMYIERLGWCSIVNRNRICPSVCRLYTDVLLWPHAKYDLWSVCVDKTNEMQHFLWMIFIIHYLALHVSDYHQSIIRSIIS